LPAEVRTAAASAASSVASLVLAHGESPSFEPFRNKSYSDAAGPTFHFPVTKRQIDPWSPVMRETDTAFYKKVDGDRLLHALFA
jgi:hypothetical protein